jgi:serine/threonine protein kinase
MSDGDDLLKEITQKIVDGGPVDWDDVKARLTGPDHLAIFEELQLLWHIATFHRQGVGPEEEAAEVRLLKDIADRHRDGAAGEDGEGESDLEEGPFTWGQLQVLQPLGKGSYGRVYRAFDNTLNREVALKLFPVNRHAPPEATEAILREGKHLGKVRHSNVMHVYQAAFIDGRVGIWGELVQGRNLAQLIDANETLSAPEASVIGEVICRALTAVHRAGLLHRDIKAQNVMRESGGRIVLVDFGLGREANLPYSTEHGLELAGTPVYLAPELFKGEPATAQSDLYSVGVLLFYLVTGRFPVEGESFGDIAAKHLRGERTRLQDLRSDLPGVFVHVVDRALRPDRADRYQSAGELEQALSATLGPSPLSRPIVTPRSRLLPALIAGGAVLLLLAGFIGREYWPKPAPKEIALTLPAPAGTTFVEGSRNVPAVSPDGNHIAFLAKSSRDDMLWVRSLSDPEPRVIPNTNGAIRPFWSTDSKEIAYFVNQGDKRGLWRVNISGAQPEFLAPGTESRGGSWNSANTLLLALDPQHGLQAMTAAANATPRFVTKVDPGAKESQHMWPQFLPDGERFIFFVLSSDDNVEGVYLGSLAGGRPKLLVRSHTSALHVGGSLIYSTNGRLFTQVLDTAAGRLTGTPVELNLKVDSTYDWLLVLAASENGTLVYRQPELRQLAWYNLSGNDLGPLGEPSRFRNPTISPDGTMVVAERYRLDRRELVKFDLSRGGEETLPLPRGPSFPVWAPDGRRLTFAAMPELYANIYMTDVLNPSRSEVIVRSTKEKEPTGWSPDGRTLAYVVIESAGQVRNQDLWMSTSEPQRPDLRVEQPFATSSAAEVNGVFSPGGRWIAYVSNEEQRANVYVSRPGDRTRHKVSSGPGLDPQWISDESLLYLDPEGVLWRTTIPAGNPSRFKAQRLFRTPVRTPGTSRNNYAVAPDKERLLFNAWPYDASPTTFSVVVNWRGLGDR